MPGAPRVIELLLAALGLGLAGLDPAGALLAAGTLGGGARERYVAAYGLVSLLGTVAFGTALSLIVGPRIAGIDFRRRYHATLRAGPDGPGPGA